ncbi:MAG: sulfur carrier protein ThiS [Alphaproteobacteria bacterium GM202ARS2]|nr:sulfur carrier protein ThiS [Alphaproteobacteria bacterium GM202ARS2]
MMVLKVNGARVHYHEKSSTVLAFLRWRGIDAERRGLAVAVDGVVVQRDDWHSTILRNGQTIEVVTPMAGG